MVEVLVLGPVVVLRDGGTVSPKSASQRLILAHLALAGGSPVSEHLLIDELWDDPPTDPAHALQAHVSRLRQVTMLPIEHTTSGYRLNTLAVPVDAVRFEHLLRPPTDATDPHSVIQARREAIALWHGAALADVPDTSGLHAQRMRLNLLYDQAVTDLVDAQLEVGETEAVLPLLHEATESNPVDERRWGQLMIALDRSGNRSQALATFARAREALVEHLGLEPNAHLQKIHHDILNGTVSTVDIIDADAPAASPPGGLYGRNDEWATLVGLRDEAQRHQRVAVIMGEPGIGKTYLASQFVSRPPTTSVHVARCHATHDAPYGALAQLIRSDCSSLNTHDLAERLGAGATALRDVVPDVVEQLDLPAPVSSEPLDPQVEHHRIKLALTTWLRHASASQPLCLMIDDLHWADADSIRLLTELWADAQNTAVFWIVTLRDHEHLPSSARATLIGQAIRPSASVVQVALHGLSRPAVADLVRTATDGGCDHLTDHHVEEILAATAGNPLFVLESARHMAGDGSGTVLTSPLPPNLTSIIEGHIARLDPADRELLEVAAIAGDEFDPLLVGLAAGREVRELDGFLAAAQHLRLLEPVGTTMLRHRFRHALVRAVVSQQIAPVRRAQLHLRVAEAVEHHPHAPDRLHVLAQHYVQAVSLVGTDQAVARVLAAADASQRQRAPAVAAGLYRQAQELLTADSPAAQRCEVYLGLGEAGFRAGIDYRADLLTAARLASENGDVERLVRAAVANNRGWYSSLVEVDRDRVSVIEAALSMLAEETGDNDPAARSRLLSLWAMENVRDPSRRTDVLDRSAEAMLLAEGLGDQDFLGEIMCHRFSVLYATFADPVGTFEFAQQLDELAHARVDPELQLKSAIAVAQSAMLVADYATADRGLERSQQLAIELAHPPRLWLVNNWIATRTAMRGDIETAQVRADEALELGMALEQPDAFTWYAGQLFVFAHMSGRLPDLATLIEEQVAELTEQIPAWHTAYALTLAVVDRWDEAQAIVDEFRAARFAQLPIDVLYLHGLCYLADTAITMSYADAAQDLYEALAPYQGMVASNATIDAGPVDLRLGGLAALRGHHDLARDHLSAAEAFCHASHAASWLEHVVKAQAVYRRCSK